jgi:hypothetical protein
MGGNPWTDRTGIEPPVIKWNFDASVSVDREVVYRNFDGTLRRAAGNYRTRLLRNVPLCGSMHL